MICQQSKSNTPNDYFSSYELEQMAKNAYEMGFDETMSKSISSDLDSLKMTHVPDYIFI